MKDVFTNWRTGSTNLTATETTAAIDVGAAPVGGWPIAIHVPAQNASGDTLTITFEESDAVAGTYRAVQTVRPTVTGAGTADAPIDPHIRLFNTLAFVRCVLTVAGSTPDFGDVTVGMDDGIRRNNLQLGVATAP